MVFSRTTTRSATARSAIACRRRRARWPRSARCSRRTSRCCSWARSTASTRRFSSSPTTSTRRSRRRRARAGARSSRRSPQFCKEEIPDPAGPRHVRALEADAPARSASSPRCTRELLRARRRLRSGRRRRDRVRRGRALAAGPPGRVRARLQLRAGAAARAVLGRRRWCSRRTTEARGGRPADTSSSTPLSGALIALTRRSGPGARSRSARRGTAAAPTSRSSPSTPRGRAVPVRRRRQRDADRDDASARALNWHCYLPGSARAALRLPRPRPVRAARGPPLQPRKLLIDPYAKAIDGVVDWAHDANVLPYVPDRRRGRRPRARRRGRRGGDAEVGRDRRRVHLGGRPPAAGPVRRHRHLRDARQGLHDAPPRRPRGPARHLRRARLRAGDRLPAPTSA